jgi:hypothetical protein
VSLQVDVSAQRCLFLPMLRIQTQNLPTTKTDSLPIPGCLFSLLTEISITANDEMMAFPLPESSLSLRETRLFAFTCGVRFNWRMTSSGVMKFGD